MRSSLDGFMMQELNTSPVRSSSDGFMMQEIKRKDVPTNSDLVARTGTVAQALSFGGASSSRNDSNFDSDLEITGVPVKPSSFELQNRQDVIYTTMYNQGVNVDDPEFRVWQNDMGLVLLPYKKPNEVVSKQSINPRADLSFTPEEEAKFAKHYDEGYDVKTDERYNIWKSRKEKYRPKGIKSVDIVETPEGVEMKMLLVVCFCWTMFTKDWKILMQ